MEPNENNENTQNTEENSKEKNDGIVTFDSLSEENIRRVLSMLSRGLLSENEKRLFWESCARSKLTEEEQRKIKRAFVLSRMTDDERRELLQKNRQKAEEAEKKGHEEPVKEPKAENMPQKDEEIRKTGETSAQVSDEELRAVAAKKEAAQREAAVREAAEREAAQREAAAREAAEREAAAREAAQREAAQRETAAREAAARREAEEARRKAAREAAIRENAVRDESKRKQTAKTNTRKPEKKQEPVREEEADHTAITSLLKGIVYIVSVLVISIFASWAIISVGNDVFAFVKSKDPVTVIIDEDMTVHDVAQMLGENGIIKYPTIYELYIRIKDESTNYMIGEYEITPSLNYKQINRTFTYIETTKEQVVIMIPEGYTIDQMIDLFLSYGIGTREGFVDVINNYPFEGYRFLDELKANDPERKYRLEGYLFPDTYYFFKDSKEVTVIDKLLTNFDRKITDAYYDRAQQLGLSMDEIITLASMVQAEGTTLDDFVNISSVFHNRLDRPTQYPKLQSDATLQYVLDKRKAALTAEDLKINSKYNTYLNNGLPPSAVCNPSLDAINSALYPESTKYYYFLADSKGHTYFSETLEEHEAKKKEYIDNAK